MKSNSARAADSPQAGEDSILSPDIPAQESEPLLHEFKKLKRLLGCSSEDGKLRHSAALNYNFEHEVYPYKKPMSRQEYEARKQELQTELLKLQRWVNREGIRITGVFEGRDAAGKGGSIKRFMEHLNPRTAHVRALEKPSQRERGQWYFQRYVAHLPTRGEMVFFDRSWYNRAGVENVMEFCSREEYENFLRQCPVFEEMLVGSGIRLFKYWFSVSRFEQLRRFYERRRDPLKQWKLSPVDLQSLERWDDYTRAKEAMFFHTDTSHAPWTVIRADDKKRARIDCMRHFLSSFEYPDRDEGVVGTPDPKIVSSAASFYDDDAAAF